jgi:hypothetical protein
MNGGLISSNFLVGMIVARNLPRQDQLLVGLSAGQMGASSAVGIVGLKQLVDGRTDSDARAASAEVRAVNAETALAECLANKVGGVAGAGGDGAHVAVDRRKYDPEALEEYKKTGKKEHRRHYLAA